MSAFTSELKANDLASKSLGDKWKGLVERSKDLFSAASIVATVFSQVRQSISSFLQLDTAMTNLYKVQDQITSRDQFSGLLDKWNKLAQNLAVTTDSLINSAAEWSKIGFDLNMSEQLAQITSVFEKTAEISNNKASSTLISAAQAFSEIDDLGVDDYVERVEAVGDKINAIGNKYSIDSEGIADGLQNASAALKVAGNDLNETIALISATNKIYQSPSEASNMLKVASMRLRGQVDALKEMGEDAEGVSTDITKIQQQIYELTGNKVNIFEDEDNLKSTYQMMLEIGQVFDSLTDRQQADLLEKMFGKQRASAGASLLLNYEELEKIKNDSMNAAGSMAEEYGKYMESAEAHITVFKEKLIETYSSFMSGDLIKYTADVGSGILDLVNSTDLLRHGIIGILALNIGKGITNIGTAIASTFKQMDMLGSALQQIRNLPIDVSRVDTLYELGESTKRLSDNNLKLLLSQRQLSEQDRINILSARGLAEEEARTKLEKMSLVTATKAQSAANVAEVATTTTLSGAMLSLKASIIGVGTSIKAAFLANPIGMSIMAISTAVGIATTVMSKYKESINKANEATKEAIESLQSITSEVESLENKISEINQEINGLDSITDAQDIENLRLQNEELATQLAILKEKQKVAAMEADKAAQDSLNTKQGSKYKFDTFTDSMGGVAVVASQVTKEEELLNAIEAYDSYKARVDEANKALADMAKTGDYTQKEWDVQEKAIEKYSDGMLKARSHANELAVELTEQVQGLNGSTEASQALINSVETSIAGYNKWIGTIDNTTDSLKEQADVQAEVAENASLFNITDHEEAIDNIQSTISTLRSALDSFNQGTLDESAVLDLMQQFPALIPYIDLAADGFGNLSQGLSVLIAQQPSDIIYELEKLKASLNTDEERAQVDMLIDSLQQLSSYGDTGMEAYATSIGATWNDTANVIGSVTTQFENLAKVQEAVSNGLTMSATAAAELAQMYPEILTNCEVAANGQITLNEDVVKSILAGDQSIVDAQIKKLEADKAVLEAKQRTAEAELEIVKNVGTAKGQITEEEARNQIEALEAELKAELEKDRQTVESYAVATESKMQNASLFDAHVATVASDIATNMLSAAVSMASNMKLNSESSQQSLIGIGHKAAEVARSVAAIGTKQVVETSDKLYSSGGSIGGNIAAIGTKNIPKMVNNVKNAVSATRDYLDGNIDLGDFQSQLELDIKGYSDAIANIDGQIAVLKNLQATFKDTVDSANGGIGGHNYADKIKQLEDEKDKINSALDDAKSGSGSSSKETEDNFEELVDFFLRRIDVLDSALSLLKAHLDNVTGSFAKNQLVDAMQGITEEKFKNYSDALNMYTQKANEALSKLPTDIAAKVKDGAVDLTTFIGEGNEDVVEAIKDYENWADKVADCKQELAELKEEIRQLELQKFNNIVEDFTNQFDLREDSKSLISKQIALLEEAGELIGESFFNVQIDQSKKQLALLEEEKAQLVSQMESAINSGRVEKATDEWLEMARSINEVDGEILSCQKSIEEFSNELLNLNWKIFERIQDTFGNISSELDNLAGLFDDFNDIRVSDGKGTWTREAIATLGLYAQQYEVAKYQVEQYSDAMDKLKQDYLDGKYSATEYMDKLADLSKGQWDAVNSAESLEDAIYNLNKTRIEEEIETIED